MSTFWGCGAAFEVLLFFVLSFVYFSAPLPVSTLGRTRLHVSRGIVVGSFWGLALRFCKFLSHPHVAFTFFKPMPLTEFEAFWCHLVSWLRVPKSLTSGTLSHWGLCLLGSTLNLMSAILVMLYIFLLFSVWGSWTNTKGMNAFLSSVFLWSLLAWIIQNLLSWRHMKSYSWRKEQTVQINKIN